MTERPKPRPGDRVLVPAAVVEGRDGSPMFRFDGVWDLYLSGEGAVAHPGIDPALIGELVEAVREWYAAEIALQEAHGAHERAEARRRVAGCRGRVRAIAARMDKEEGDE